MRIKTREIMVFQWWRQNYWVLDNEFMASISGMWYWWIKLMFIAVKYSINQSFDDESCSCLDGNRRESIGIWSETVGWFAGDTLLHHARLEQRTWQSIVWPFKGKMCEKLYIGLGSTISPDPENISFGRCFHANIHHVHS